MLRFIDGFDHLATADILGKWATASLVGGGGIGTSSPAPRTGAGQLNLARNGTGSDTVTAAIGSLATTVIIGFGFQYTAAPSATTNFLAIGDGSVDAGTTSPVAHLWLVLTSTGTLALYRVGSTGSLGGNSLGSATLLGTSASALSVNQWYYIEVKATIHNTTGAAEVRVNGSAVIGPLTSQDTQNGANAYANVFGLGGVGNTTAKCVYDDLYVADDVAGDGVTTFLGPQKVATVIASAGNGTYTQWTPSTGTDHGALVDEATPNGDTDYNSSSTVGQRDSYNFAALGVSGTVTGVQATGWLKTDISGSRMVNHFARIGTTDYDGTAGGIDVTYRALRQVWGQSPATSTAWTVAEIDAAEFGVRVQA